jgi:hypothetical protein
MITTSEKLAASLEKLKQFQNDDKTVVIRSRDLSRTHRERLLKNGFIREVLKGWYIQTQPGLDTGESTFWFTSFWTFCAKYFAGRFGHEWCLSPEQSVAIHAGNWTIPVQLLVRSPHANNNVVNLPFETALIDVKSSIPIKGNMVRYEELQLFSLSNALINCAPNYFVTNQIDCQAALAIIKDSSEILTPLLKGGHSTIAGRIAGAFRNIGRDNIADEIVKTMKSAEYDVREENPFVGTTPTIIPTFHHSAYVNRINLLWEGMRNEILDNFPQSAGLPDNPKLYLSSIEEKYQRDAYHSLSIEGYKVTPELIEQVRLGSWNPDTNNSDNEQQDALAARGYWKAFQIVIKSVMKVLNNENPGKVVQQDHRDWYREMLSPSIVAGIINASDLAGYRNSQVYIQNSKHVPQNHNAVRDSMPGFFNLLCDETEPAVRAVLGHFIFVIIHPYMDGNGRMGRFLMNTMLASGGYPWTIIPIDRRTEYMISLEKASVESDIAPFTSLLADLVKQEMQ